MLRCAVWAGGLAVLAAGCGNSVVPGADGGAGSPAGRIALPQIVGRYVIAAGQEKQSKAILPPVTLRGADATVTMRLRPADASFTPTDSVGGTMLYAVAFGVVSNFDEACAEPVDSYSPFTITVDAQGRVVDVAGEFELAASTVNLLRSNSYTICTTYSSNVAGTIIVDALTLE
jgi:hypothetical protein